MSRRKGEITRAQIDREYPYQVEIVIPPGGLGRRLDEMHRFCAGLADYRTRGARKGAVDACRWCFAEASPGEAFQRRFGGIVVAPDNLLAGRRAFGRAS